ncbi:hypothetical protein ABIE44_001467 [Marmoricola sp. OAE513]
MNALYIPSINDLSPTPRTSRKNLRGEYTVRTSSRSAGRRFWR